MGKRIRYLVAAVVLIIGLAPALAEDPEHAGIGIGDAAPMADTMMKSVDGHELSIAQASGKKGTLVIFSCNACPWVKAWQERIADLGNTYSAKGIGVIAINSNDPARNAEDGFDVMQERARDLGFHFPYVVDETSDVARAFGATRTPEAFLFDAGGKLVYHGTIDDNAKEPDKVSEHYLQDALDAVVAGKEVPLHVTKALGCGIKFRGAS